MSVSAGASSQAAVGTTPLMELDNPLGLANVRSLSQRTGGATAVVGHRPVLCHGPY
jgi:hypothetical protein